MASNISFLPEDFDSVLLRSDLEEALSELISEIRSSNSSRNNELLLSIQKLEEYQKRSLNSKNVQEIFNIYKQIIHTSLEMRKLLSEKISLEVYDSIAYSFYIDGQRYSTESLKADWLTVRNNGLFVNLGKAEEELKKSLEASGKQRLSEIFNEHYLSYLTAITGMYKGTLGARGSKINKGHVAEAYEAHMAEHHSQVYQLLNSLNTQHSVLDKITAVSELEISGKDYWAIHEDPNAAWRHIRGAKGNQRGTVAGDVGRYQVKQIADKFGSLRLSSLANLELGIKNYCMITNPNIPVTDVAHKLAIYMTEVVSNKDKQIQAYLANKYLQKSINDLAIERVVHI